MLVQGCQNDQSNPGKKVKHVNLFLTFVMMSQSIGLRTVVKTGMKLFTLLYTGTPKRKKLSRSADGRFRVMVPYQ